MRKRFMLTLVLISILAALWGVAAAPEQKRSVSLVETNYYREKGVVFKFKLSGEFKDNELKGSVLVDKKTIKVYCVRTKNGGAQCVAASVTSRLAGKQGIIKFAGYSFAFIVPARPR